MRLVTCHHELYLWIIRLHIIEESAHVILQIFHLSIILFDYSNGDSILVIMFNHAVSHGWFLNDLTHILQLHHTFLMTEVYVLNVLLVQNLSIKMNGITIYSTDNIEGTKHDIVTLDGILYITYTHTHCLQLLHIRYTLNLRADSTADINHCHLLQLLYPL